MISIFNTVHMASARQREKNLMQSIATGKDTEKLENPGNQASFQRADWGARKAKAISDGMAALEVSLGRDRHIAQESYDAAKLIREEFMRISAIASENTGYQPIDVPAGPLPRTSTWVSTNSITNGPVLTNHLSLTTAPGFSTAKKIVATEVRIRITFSNPSAVLDANRSEISIRDLSGGGRSIRGRIVSENEVQIVLGDTDIRQFMNASGQIAITTRVFSTPIDTARISRSVTFTTLGSTKVETLQTYRVPSPVISRLRSIHEGMADLLKPLSGAAVGADDNLSSVRANHEKIGEMLEQIEVRGNFTELDLSLINGIIDENLNALTGLGLRQSTVEFERSLLNEFSEQTDAKAKGSIEADLAEKSIELASASRVYRVSQEMMMDFVASQDQRKISLVSMLVR